MNPKEEQHSLSKKTVRYLLLAAEWQHVDETLLQNVRCFPQTLSLILVGVGRAVHQAQTRRTHRGERSPAELSRRLEGPHLPG